jgi:3-deoxy-D-manno-octulosonic acid kinase
MEGTTESHIAISAGGILCDGNVDFEWEADAFTVEYWRHRGRLQEAAVGGRGTVVFLQQGDDEWALRHYQRGGLFGRLFEDHYLWTGEAKTRSFREWRLLNQLYGLGLPVPRPIAASYVRTRGSYSANLITRRIPGAEPLSSRLSRATLPQERWADIGRCIRRFHDAGVWHADLTAHNLLVDRDDAPWLLDFDKGRIRSGGRWRQANLDRFLRSLRKVSRERPGLHVVPSDWQALVAAYRQIPA